MFEQENPPIWDPQGPVDNPFMLGFMGRTRTRQLDARSLNNHVRSAWEQFQTAEIKLAAAIAASDDREFVVHELASGDAFHSIRESVEGAEFSPDGSLLTLFDSFFSSS